ncbi:MAG: tetratricopeptide repeat protein [Planctomycetota bacterium]|nr:tetratricopeptide repeat protein [Planctomycetota bacterium]
MGEDDRKARVRDLAIFGRKKNDDTGEADSGGSAVESASGADEATTPDPMPFSPEKAQRFFDHAKTVGETGNHQYAMQLWLSGLRQDPSSMYGLESFLNAAVNFEGKPSKELLKSIDGKTDADKYVQAVLSKGLKIGDGPLAVKAVQAAAKIGLSEQAHYLGEQALKLVGSKPKKDLYVKLMEAFAQVQAFDLAVQAGDAAVRIDPTDASLATDVKNMSAKSTMSRGGFDKTGEEGGFRSNIRDADKQRQLDESERISKTDETIDRLIVDAEAAFRDNPEDMPKLGTLTKRLLERGRPEDEQRAIRLMMKGFESTKQFRFRQDAGKIRLRQLKRTLNTYKERAEANPDNEQYQKEYEQARAKYNDIEIGELKASVEAYPTDLVLKFQLGKKYFDKQDYDQAIALLQDAKGDARYRARALSLLGQSFAAMDWHDEAIATYRQALEDKATLSDDLQMELRYGLLISLAAKAEADTDLASAEEAEKLASTIAIEQFGYRDIRERREVLKKLVASLKQGG